MSWMRTIVGGVLLTAACAGGAAAQSLEELNGGGTPSRPTPDLKAVARQIIQRTNQFREDQGREPTSSNPELMKTAADFARYMARHDKYGHTADGRRPSQRASQHGYRYCIIAENIAYQYSSQGFGGKQLARRFFQGWKHSPEHRKNMLDRDVTETGVAVAHSESSGAYYAVQMFGRPKSKQIKFQVVNRGAETLTYQVKGRDRTREFSLPPRVTRTHQRCRPAELVFTRNGQRRTIDIENGGHYVLAGRSSRGASTGR